MAAHLARGVTPLEVSYHFAHTFAWEEARRRIEAGAASRVAACYNATLPEIMLDQS